MTYVLSSKLIKLLSRLFFLTLISSGLHSRLLSKDNITFKFDDLALKPALSKLIEEHDISIIFPDSIPNTLITARCDGCNMDEAVSEVLELTNLIWKKNHSQFIIHLPLTKPYFSLSGRVVDLETDEPIPYANIFIPSLSLGDITNHDGTFSISNISVRSCSLYISYIGYETKKTHINFPRHGNTTHKFSLLPKILTTEEISILGTPKEFLDRSNNPGQVSFSPRHISTLPNLGEVDIFRSLQFLPGVQLGLGETSDLYIRGGLPDQNLVLLDWMPIYQTGHMFGFVSGVSANAIKDIQVYKGSIPVKYGGRISSVIDLSSRSGNSLNARGSFYGNLMSQGFSAELPLFNRGSWIVSYRRSNPSNNYSKLYTSIQEYVTGDDKFNLLSQTASEENDQNTYYDILSTYHDIINRLSILISPKHRITITQLNGIDSVIENRNYHGFNSILGGDTVIIQENTDILNKGMVMNCYSNWSPNYNTHFSLSRYKIINGYDSEQHTQVEDNFYSQLSTAKENHHFSDHSMRFHQTYKGITNHKIYSGIEEKYLELSYEKKNEEGVSTNNSFTNQKEFSHSFYLEDQWNPSKPWQVQSGIRILYYMGKQKFYAEPRFALKYTMNPKLSLEASSGQHYQFIHHLANTTKTGTMQNNWLLSSDIIPIISSLNNHFGINWDDPKYALSLSIYNRLMKNLFQFDDSFDLYNNEINFDTNVSIGAGEKRGLEFILRKKHGSVLGWVSYHLNKTEYDFPDLNNGNKYLANHDKTHELKTVLITRIWNMDLTANWVFSSGGLYTDINNKYVEPGSGFNIITTGNINEKRLPTVHHLDIGISRSWNISKANINIGFSIYNIYNKNNFSHKRYNPYTSQLSDMNVSMFGITPSINLKISF